MLFKYRCLHHKYIIFSKLTFTTALLAKKGIEFFKNIVCLMTKVLLECSTSVLCVDNIHSISSTIMVIN